MKTLHSSLVMLLVWAFTHAAFAHDPGLSSANIARTPDHVKVTLTLAWPDLAMARAAVTGSDIASIEAEPPPTFGPEWSAMAAGFVRVVADGAVQNSDVPSLLQSRTEAADVIVEITWPRVAAVPLRVEFPVLTKLPFGHRMVLTLDDSTEPVALLRERLAVWELPAPVVSTLSTQDSDSGAVPAATPSSWTSFLLLGVEHILIGFDHLCFLLALLIVAPRLRDVVALVTTFTVAHSLTLAAAATGLVSLSPRMVEPLIAISIIYIGLENLVLRKPPRHRLLVVFAFGLIHGLGFASVLGERLPGVTGFGVLPPLLAFNVGVELGQLAVAACLVPLILLARAQPRLAPKFQPALSLVIASAGVIWLFQRV
jgi:hydrogenase/urease accessory protein HupE